MTVRHQDPDARGRGLFGAVSEIAGLAAWLHADLVEPARARRMYQLAISAAHRSGHRLLPAYMQGSFGQYAVAAGDPRDGLRVTRDAAARLPKAAPHQARAWLMALEGVALAHLGDRAATRALDTAERHAEQAANDEPEWPWVFRFDAAKLAGHRATAATRLGMPRAAVATLQMSGWIRGPKQAALLSVEQARALVAIGDAAEATRLAGLALGAAKAYDSERVRQAVRDFRVLLPNSATTVDLDAQLHSSYTTEGA